MSIPTDDELLAQFRKVFERIAEGAPARERERRLLHEEVGWLRDAGFGAVRVPVDQGGFGASLTQLFLLLIELAAAESNLPQALRSHFGFLEGQLAEPGGARRDRWLELAGAGTLFAGATSERENQRGTVTTSLRTDSDGKLRLNGTKYYSTGGLYANYLVVSAVRENEEQVRILVSTQDDGVQQIDDWTGFGQRLTASGTTRFTDVLVDPSQVFPARTQQERRPALGYFQLVQLAGLAGIARRAADDVAEYVRRRRRTWGHGNADLVRDDPLVQQVVGRVDSAAFAARATVLAAASALDSAVRCPDPDAVTAAEVDVYRAQVSVIDLVLGATTALFDVGGASAVDEELRLDRHWRNARTLAVHNPVIYKQRMVGDYLLNDAEPEIGLSVGVASRIPADPPDHPAR